MAITVRSNVATKVTAAVTDTSMTVTRPSGWKTGDKMLWFFVNRAGTGVTVTAPTGWTLESSVSQGSNCTLSCFSKTIAYNEASSWSISWTPATNCVSIIVCLKGAKSSKNVVATAVTNPTNTTHTIPTATTTVDNCAVLRVLGLAGGTTITPDAATTELGDTRTNNGTTSATLEVSWETLATAGATGTRTVTSGATGIGVEMTIAVAPQTVYYVDKATGLDSRSTTQAQNPSTPYATIAKALGVLAGGEFVSVAAGIGYDGWALGSASAASGTANDPTIVEGDNSYGTEISGANSHARHTYISNVVWRNLNFDWRNYTGTQIDGFIPRGDNVTIEEAYFLHNPNPNVQPNTFKALLSIDGSGVVGVTNNEMTGFAVRYCFFQGNIGYDWVNDAVQDHAIYVTDGVSGIIEYNIFNDFRNGRATKFGKPTDPSPQIIPRNNTWQYNTAVKCPGPGQVALSHTASGHDINHNIIVGPNGDDNALADDPSHGIVGHPQTFTGSGDAPAVFTSNLNGLSSSNTVTNNYVWMNDDSNHFISTGYASLTQSGNTYADPQIDNAFTPQNAALFSGGVYTHGHLAGFASRSAWPGPPVTIANRLTSRIMRRRRG